MSEKILCKNCGKEISYFEGNKGWFHLPFMTYYCSPQPSLLLQKQNPNHAELETQ